jgi:hypothetical protein
VCFEENFLEKYGGEPREENLFAADCENTIPSVCAQSFPPQIALDAPATLILFSKSKRRHPTYGRIRGSLVEDIGP